MFRPVLLIFWVDLEAMVTSSMCFSSCCALVWAMIPNKAMLKMIFLFIILLNLFKYLLRKMNKK